MSYRRKEQYIRRRHRENEKFAKKLLIGIPIFVALVILSTCGKPKQTVPVPTPTVIMTEAAGTN